MTEISISGELICTYLYFFQISCHFMLFTHISSEIFGLLSGVGAIVAHFKVILFYLQSDKNNAEYPIQ